MNRLLFSLAALAICTQAFAGNTSNVHTPLQPIRQGPTGLVPLVPQLTSAKFVKSQVLPGEALNLKFDGTNLVPGGGAGSGCVGIMTLPPGFGTNTNNIVPVATNGTWEVYPGQYNAYTLTAPTIPGTYAVTVTVDNVVSGYGSDAWRCKGTVTAHLTVIYPPSVPQTAK